MGIISFLGMWGGMVVTMLPAVAPALGRYRQTLLRSGVARANPLTALVATGYLLAWLLVGMALLPVDLAWMAMEMRMPVLLRWAPAAAGTLVLLAGALQLTSWKTRRLAICRGPCEGEPVGASAGEACRHGLRLGARCCACCLNLMVIPLISGMMDWWVMITVMVAIGLERLVPGGMRTARATGVAVAGAGVALIAHAAGLG